MSSIKSEKCRIYLGINSNRANFSSVDCQSSIMVRVKMRAPMDRILVPYCKIYSSVCKNFFVKPHKEIVWRQNCYFPLGSSRFGRIFSRAKPTKLMENNLHRLFFRHPWPFLLSLQAKKIFSKFKPLLQKMSRACCMNLLLSSQWTLVWDGK